MTLVICAEWTWFEHQHALQINLTLPLIDKGEKQTNKKTDKLTKTFEYFYTIYIQITTLFLLIL